MGDEQRVSSAIVKGEQVRTAIVGGRAINRIEVVGGGARNRGSTGLRGARHWYIQGRQELW
jgi:hypothetical protein